MSKKFQFSLFAILIPIILSFIGFLIVPKEIIVQFNQPAYGNKSWLFLIPILLIILGALFAWLVRKDRQKKEFVSPAIVTPLENNLMLADYALVIIATIIIIMQIINGK